MTSYLIETEHTWGQLLRIARSLVVAVSLSPEVWRESSILLGECLSKGIATNVAKSNKRLSATLLLLKSILKKKKGFARASKLSYYLECIDS